MRIWKTLQKTLVGACVAAALAACGSGGSGGNVAPVPTPVPTPVATQTVWQPDGAGYMQFMTNDTQYCGRGLLFSHNPSNEAQTTTVSATVMKKSGAANYGYGIIFGYQDTDNFYRLLIDALGHYTLHVKVGGVYSTIIPWGAPHTAIINPGYNVDNVITVTQQTLHTFTVSFNGVQETQFTDSNFSGGVDGFYVSVSSNTENFPTVPVDVRCKLTSPVDYPALSTTGVQAVSAQAAGAIEGYELGVAVASP